jgi:hypothetical protein
MEQKMMMNKNVEAIEKNSKKRIILIEFNTCGSLEDAKKIGIVGRRNSCFSSIVTYYKLVIIKR